MPKTIGITVGQTSAFSGVLVLGRRSRHAIQRDPFGFASFDALVGFVLLVCHLGRNLAMMKNFVRARCGCSILGPLKVHSLDAYPEESILCGQVVRHAWAEVPVRWGLLDAFDPSPVPWRYVQARATPRPNRKTRSR